MLVAGVYCSSLLTCYLQSANDLEVEDRLLERAEQPQPDRHNHLRAARSSDVPQIDDVGPAEAPEQLGHLGLRLPIVATNEHAVVRPGKLSGVDHEVGVHGVQGLDYLRLGKSPLDPLAQRVGVRHPERRGHASREVQWIRY